MVYWMNILEDCEGTLLLLLQLLLSSSTVGHDDAGAPRGSTVHQLMTFEPAQH